MAGVIAGLKRMAALRPKAASTEWEKLMISNGNRFDHPKLIALGITWTF
jgi:hypothetical protein